MRWFVNSCSEEVNDVCEVSGFHQDDGGWQKVSFRDCDQGRYDEIRNLVEGQICEIHLRMALYAAVVVDLQTALAVQMIPDGVPCPFCFCQNPAENLPWGCHPVWMARCLIHGIWMNLMLRRVDFRYGRIAVGILILAVGGDCGPGPDLRNPYDL